MTMDFKLPELGEGVYEAELVAWLVQPGQTVKRGQSLMEVLTDKATMSCAVRRSRCNFLPRRKPAIRPPAVAMLTC